MTQATILQSLILGTLPGNTHHKNFRCANCRIPKELQTDFKNKDISLPTNYHPFELNTSNLHTPPNPDLTQPTSTLIWDPPFDKTNFICPMGDSLNLNLLSVITYTLLPSCTSWPSIPCSTYSPSTVQISGIPNHVAWATNWIC